MATPKREIPKYSLEEVCDLVLDEMFKLGTLTNFGSLSRLINIPLIEKGTISDEQLEAAMAILMDDGLLITGNPSLVPDRQNATLRIGLSAKGRTFKIRTSYAEQAELAKLKRIHEEKERIKLEQDIELNGFQLKTKGWAFWISVAAIVISAAALIVSIVNG